MIYTSVPVTGFNAAPPPDDGTASTANQLTWQKHLDKIGTPLKTAVEAINANLLTAFAKIFGNGVLEKSANYTVTVSDIGKIIAVTGTATITLPAAASAGEGFPLGIFNAGTGVVTVDGNASELINGSASVVLDRGGFALLTSDGAEWQGIVDQGVLTGTFSPTPNGVSSPSGTMLYRIQKNLCTLGVTVLVGGVSNANTFTVSALPAVVTPSVQTAHATTVANTGIANIYPGRVVVTTGGVLQFQIGSPFLSTNFTNDGNVKGLPVGGWSLTYPLW